ncbi:Clp protease N-terminal domain-containing protein [Nocardia sp. NPDC057455]|uniref:Clp protease N-terminal domain-containing protein n=1 Tax=Nocardia sp. NPDC057455 TaxID=3346138 RepID=UPI0036707F26
MAHDGLIRTPRFEQVVEAAADIARGRGDEYVGVEHLMLAILAAPDTVPTLELHALGIDPRRIAAAIETTMREPGYLAPSYRARHLDGKITDYDPVTGISRRLAG